MKNSIKSLELVELGLSSKIVSKLSESQVSTLHGKLLNEEIKTQVTRVTYDPSNVVDQQKLLKKGVQFDPSTKKITMPEIEESEEEQREGKKGKKNPWAICHAKLGPRKNAKFESCVKQVKESLKEEKKEVTSFLENKIVDLLEKYLPPKITKGDLIKYLVEDKPAVAPKPGTKEPKPDTKNPPKIKPSHPGRNPNPKVNPAPKAKRNEISPEVAKDEVLDLIKNILEK